MTEKTKKVMDPELKGKINEVLKAFIFDLNDEETRAKVKHAVDVLVSEQYKKGDYFVNCDAKNNNLKVIEEHALVVEVGVRGDKLYQFRLSPKITNNLNKTQ